MKNQVNIGVAILGGTGYGAGELLRLLAAHPNTEVVSITSTSQVGKNVSDAHPHLASFYQDLAFTESIDFRKLNKFTEKCIITSLPHGTKATEIEKQLA